MKTCILFCEDEKDGYVKLSCAVKYYFTWQFCSLIVMYSKILVHMNTTHARIHVSEKQRVLPGIIKYNVKNKRLWYLVNDENENKMMKMRLNKL